MDADRFDTLARSLSAPRSRRAALSGAAAGGLLGALGLGRAVPETRAAQGGTCVVEFAANEGRAGEVQGNLSFSLSASGNLENAALTLPDGTQLPVVGQATGHSLQLRIALGPQRALVAVGVGEEEISRCQGAIDGVVSGPQSGDLGDWRAAAGVQNVPASGQGQGTAAGQGSAPGTERGARAQDSGRGATGSSSAGTANGSTQTDTPGTGSRSSAPSCPAGETYCAYVEECRDLRTSPLDCGACGTRCPSLVCQEGRCLSEEEADSRGSTGLECDPDETICDGYCVSLRTDPNHCGACGNACDFNVASCQDGSCVFRPDENCPTGQIQCGATCCDACPSGTVNCGSDPPLCVDILTDPSHCGLCGTICAPGGSCQGGECVGGGGCKDGNLTFCGDSCVDINIDRANCGGCGIACATGEACQSRICTPTTTEAPPPPTCADQGLIECFGACVNLQTDPNHCGYCGEVCPSGQCDAGICIEVVGPAPSLDPLCQSCCDNEGGFIQYSCGPNDPGYPDCPNPCWTCACYRAKYE